MKFYESEVKKMYGIFKRYRLVLAIILFSTFLILIVSPLLVFSSSKNSYARHYEAKNLLQWRLSPNNDMIVKRTPIIFNWKSTVPPSRLPEHKDFFQLQTEKENYKSIFKEIKEVPNLFSGMQSVRTSVFTKDNMQYNWMVIAGILNVFKGEIFELGQSLTHMTLATAILPVEKYGDVNNDGEISVQDVLLVMRHVLELEILAEAQRKAADVNYDGEIDVKDVTLIMQKVLGKIDQLPASKIGAWIEDSRENFMAQTYEYNGMLYLLVTYGVKPTGGYAVEITDISMEKDKLFVTAHFTEPAEGDEVTQALTYPYDLAVVVNPGLPVEFTATGAEKEIPIR